MADLTPPELWWRYIGLGGNRAPDALADYLTGTAEWPAFEHNIVAQAINERLWDLECPMVPPAVPTTTCAELARSRAGRSAPTPSDS